MSLEAQGDIWKLNEVLLDRNIFNILFGRTFVTISLAKYLENASFQQRFRNIKFAVLRRFEYNYIKTTLESSCFLNQNCMCMRISSVYYGMCTYNFHKIVRSQSRNSLFYLSTVCHLLHIVPHKMTVTQIISVQGWRLSKTTYLNFSCQTC